MGPSVRQVGSHTWSVHSPPSTNSRQSPSLKSLTMGSGHASLNPDLVTFDFVESLHIR